MTMTDIARHLVTHEHRTGHLLYRFRNGQEASVIPDPNRPLRWEILADAWPEPLPGLTSGEAEARLAELAALPMPEWDGKS
jgi:hypothetical protein